MERSTVGGRSTRSNVPKNSIVVSSGEDDVDCLVMWQQEGQNKKAKNGKSSQNKKASSNEEVQLDDISDTGAKRGSFKKQLCARKRNSVDDEEPPQSKYPDQLVDEYGGTERSSKRKRGNAMNETEVDFKQGPRPWTRSEDEKLIEAAIRFAGQGARGGMPWVRIREEFYGDRTATQCFHRYKVLQTYRTMEITSGIWSDEETARLVEGVAMSQGLARGGGISWVKVSEHMDGKRTPNQCCQRWNETVRHQEGGVVKSGLWTPAEDARLTSAVQEFMKQMTPGGRISWVKISEAMGGERTHNQCFKRWSVVLSHRHGVGTENGDGGGGGKGPWEAHEDEKLAEAVGLFQGQGHSGSVAWPKVSEYLGGARSSVQCRSRWVNSLQKKLQLQQNSTQSNPAVLATSTQSTLGTSTESNSSSSGVNVVGAVTGSQNHGPWSSYEDELLIKAVQKSDAIRGLFNAPGGRDSRISWVKISDQMQRIRSASQCRERWTSIVKHKLVVVSTGNSGGTATASFPSSFQMTGQSLVVAATTGAVTTKRTGHWSSEEDQQLLNCVKKFAGRGCGGGVSWVNVSHMLGNGRTPNQCFKRWSSSLKSKAALDMAQIQVQIAEEQRAIAVALATAVAGRDNSRGSNSVTGGQSQDALDVSSMSAPGPANDSVTYANAIMNTTMV